MQPDEPTPTEPQDDPLTTPMPNDPVQPLPGDDDDDPLTAPPPDDPVPPLPDDDDKPFSPPSDVPDDGVPPDHPSTDSNVQPEEVYDEGLGGAAEASDPAQNLPGS